MIRRPPKSTLFPSPPLFGSGRVEQRLRGAGEDVDGVGGEQQRGLEAELARLAAAREERERAGGHRSEEHTSELQSRQYLVCRLLLEKKKYYIHRPFIIAGLS